MKEAAVAIVGRPSTGKSTLLNRLCGHKVAIVSAVPQTTRNLVRGIVNRPAGQLIFIDTPGYHLSERRFNQGMQNLTRQSLDDVDLILYLLDVGRRPADEERLLCQLLRPHDDRLIVALNKIDQPESDPTTAESFLRQHGISANPLRLSGLTGEGCETLLEALFAGAGEGMPHYPSDYYTDQEPHFRVSEVIREQTILRLSGELPHAVYVAVMDIEQRESRQNGIDISQLWIRAAIFADSESRKAIIIGKGGSSIRDIRKSAQKIIKRLFPQQIYLDLQVKVHKNWRRDRKLLKKLLQ